ncbi:BRO-N domain-containing protein [Geopseudomonas guangdongensis]|uniref:BRO family, N-terminal domain n=1 Tax=Geopseudomonas guangdongensis TaxID=1245526 RepID=A0A1H2I6Q4_9GAMM|nr:Bro-N domain-containing protein [Pseudomonas guangdongensis]SDU39781.1 BRO family, N-terminal domain [Pseudomonas guangdongensis]
MTNQVTNFKFEGSAEIRVVSIDGNPWFVAKDVCKAIGYNVKESGDVNTSQALKPLASDEVITSQISDNRGKPPKLISESGLYKLIMRSNKPEARRFQDWVTREVLPAIRKDGAYIMGEEKVATGELDEDAFIAKAMEIMQRKIERLKEEKAKLAVENQELTHERDGLSSVVGSKMHTLGRFARTLPQINSLAIKSDLQRLGYLYRKGGTYRIYRQYEHLFVEKFNDQYGSIDIFVTEKGKTLIASLADQKKLTMKKAYAA